MNPLRTALSLALAAIALHGAGQPLPPDSLLPTDPKVIMGQLPNGMRYYIRRNAEPKERADFYIVHNVGAVLEADDQDGLAHFAEHMAFQGTKHFPGKGIINFLERIGVRFGHNINAFTAFDETVFNLSNVPTTREGIIDSALLVLHDWSSSILFEPQEIEAERGVIREEWRTGRTASWRLTQEKLRYLFHGSRYAERDIIGCIDVINRFDHQALLRFYRDWYRPDLQAVIVVGDFDPQRMEARVRELFGRIPAHENPIPRPEVHIPDHAEPLIGIYTDPEATRTMVEVYYKHPRNIHAPRTVAYFRGRLVESLHVQMFNSRMDELVQQEDPPFVFGYSFFGPYVRHRATYALIANARENESERALRAILAEGYRVKRHGFTAGELERAQADLLRRFESAYRERHQRRNEQFVEDYLLHFTANEPIPGIEFERQLAASMLPTITLDEVNALTAQWITPANRVVFISGPAQAAAHIPPADSILAIYQEIQGAPMEAWVDAVSTKPLISVPPSRGSIARAQRVKGFEATQWTLSNGMRVVIKPTDFRDDQVLLTAFSPGGFSLLPDHQLPSAILATTIASMSGLGGHTRVELDKMLAGTMVSVSPFLNEFEEGITASASPDDLELMLQLVYLHFTQPRFDRTAYNAYIARLQAVLLNRAMNPDARFNDSVQFMLSGRHPRMRPLNIDRLGEVNFDHLQDIYTDRMANASDFTVLIVGNFDQDQLRALTEQYLASIPCTGRRERGRDNRIRFPSGQTHLHFTLPMQDPKTSSFVAYHGRATHSIANMLYTSTIEYILGLRYLETIREDEGGTYGVAVRANIAKLPIERVLVHMDFDTDTARASHLVGLIHAEMQRLIGQGPSEEDLTKAREHFLKLRQERLRENSFWLGALRMYYQHNLNIVEGHQERVQGLTVRSVRRAARAFFGRAHMLEVVMRGEAPPPAANP